MNDTGMYKTKPTPRLMVSLVSVDLGEILSALCLKILQIFVVVFFTCVGL